MSSFHVKKGDEVMVIAGAAKGRKGKVTQILRDRESVILEGNDDRSKEKDDRRRLVKPVLHALRKTQINPNGGLLWLEGPIHISNVMRLDRWTARQEKKSSKPTS